MSGFVHLHLHTEYSLLDGATRISEIADKAIKEGQNAVAITDHGVMYGVVEFYDALKSKGVKPIIGCEVYVAPKSRLIKNNKSEMSGDHLVLLCKNEIGYKNLCYMVSQSFINGFYMKPRIDDELLENHSEGLVALSGCIGGKISQLIISGNIDEAEKYALFLKSVFGEDFYLEIQNHGMDDELKAAYGIKLISEKHSIPMVATNDVHYLERSDAELQATLMCIQMNTVITNGRPLGFEKDEFYFKSTSEMESLFSAYKDACVNTVKIAEKCNFDFEFDKLHLPDFKSKSGLTHKEQLRIDTLSGFENKRKQGRFDFSKHSQKEYEERIEYELSVIDRMGFNAYFLIVSDFVSYAKKSGIPVGPGRGSGAGSLVAFSIGITDVDPLAFDLLFERFLNPERVSMPDFDIDFCYNRREEVIEYVKSKYGEDKVAQIVTFGTLAPRAAIRDVGRALGMPYSTVDSVAKLVPRENGVTIQSALSTKEFRTVYESDNNIKKLIDLSKKLEGMPRHASTHAAGVVITERPTYEYVPLSYSGTGVVTQFDMNTDAKLGLVKFDFLGLRYITVIDDAEKKIKAVNPNFRIAEIPLDDKETFTLLCEGRTDGVFQLESGGMKQVLSKLQPTSLEDIIACIALYRPGPMDSIDKFIERKHGRQKIEYITPELSSILDVTYGCIVYQEQVMQICRNLAGYSYSKADLVRRAMSKKKESVMKAESEAFINGCIFNGIKREAAIEIFDEMVGFAKYAFNKSHATAYAVISYRTAYLKAHYPKEYFAALLTSVLGDTAKLREYIADAQKFKVKVLPPDINSSGVDFSVVGENIIYGLLAIKNVGRAFAKAIINESKKEKFTSFDDFISRLSGAELNKRTVESLIKCGAFDSLGVTRSSLLSCYDSIIESEHVKKRNNIAGQLDLFSMDEFRDAVSSVTFEYPKLKEFPLKELLLYEKESSGMYFSGHMLDDYTKHLEMITVDKVSDLINADTFGSGSSYKDKQSVSVAGVISEIKTKVIKNGETMAFLRFEDRISEIEVIVFAKQYKTFSNLLIKDKGIIIKGNLSFDDGEEVKIILSEIKELIPNSEMKKSIGANKDFTGNSIESKTVYIKIDSLSDKRVNNITRMSLLNPGKSKIVFYDNSTGKYVAFKDLRIEPSEKVVSRLVTVFGEGNVVLK